MNANSRSTGLITDIILGHAAGDDDGEFLRLIHPGEPDRVVSYGELVREAGRWSALYRNRGLVAGERVIVILPHSLDLYAAYIGALLAGMVPAMFAFPSPKLSEDHYFSSVGELIENVGCRLIVTYDDLADRLERRVADMLHGIAMVRPGVAAAFPPMLPEAPAGDAAAPAILQFSSGTTGLKKGVALSHTALIWQVCQYGRAIGAEKGNDRVITWLPLYHDMGLIAAFFMPLLLKVPVVAMSPFDWVAEPALWLRLASRHRATLSWLPNFAFALMAARIPDADLHGIDLSALRGVVNCSEPLIAANVEQFQRRFAPSGLKPGAVAASYAMAENTFAVTSGGFGEPPLVETIATAAMAAEGLCQPARPGQAGRTVMSSGRLLPGVELTVVDAAGRTLGERRIGELVISSPCLMTGYDNNLEATAAAMKDGRLYTGDLGYVADGHVFVTGRAKDLIIVGGRNIYPQDVEHVVNQVPGIIPGRCVAFGVVDEHQGTERLVVLAETEMKAGQYPQLKAKVFAAIARHTELVPSDIGLLAPATLLKSSSGKIARAANRDRYCEQRPAPASGGVVDPPQEHENFEFGVRDAVVRVVRRNPAAGGIAIDDQTPLMTSGLIDSFGMLDLLLELELAVGRALPADFLHQVATMDTIASIIAHLSNPEEAGPAHPVPMLDPAQIPMTYDGPRAIAGDGGFWTLFYRLFFRLKGVRVGAGLVVKGPLQLEILGDPANLRVGDNVTLSPRVHLKLRENGTIILHDGVKLDTGVRLVAANDAVIELGEDTAFGAGTIVNAGRDVWFGRGCLCSAYCMINASDHGMESGIPIRRQKYEHAPIYVGEDVFVGAHCYIGKGSSIGHGAVISAGAAVTGMVPVNAIVQGRPARVVKFRG